MIIPLFLGLGTIFLVVGLILGILYIPFDIYQDRQDSKSPITIEHVWYKKGFCSEDNKTIILNFNNFEYFVPREEYLRVKPYCKQNDIGYLIHKRRIYYGFIYKKEHLNKIDHVLSLTWDSKYQVIDSESKPVLISEIGAFMGQFFSSRKDNQTTCNFIFFNGKEYIALKKVEDLDAPYYFVPNEFKFNENIGSFVRVMYKGNTLIDCQKLSRYEIDLIEGKISDES